MVVWRPLTKSIVFSLEIKDHACKYRVTAKYTSVVKKEIIHTRSNSYLDLSLKQVACKFRYKMFVKSRLQVTLAANKIKYIISCVCLGHKSGEVAFATFKV